MKHYELYKIILFCKTLKSSRPTTRLKIEYLKVKNNDY